MIQWKNLLTTASFMVQDNLNKMTKGLTPKEYETFSQLVYFLDLQEEAQIQKERGYDEILLPNEITPKEVDEIVEFLNEEATDSVKQALIKRQNIWDELKNQYIDFNQNIGFDGKVIYRIGKRGRSKTLYGFGGADKLKRLQNFRQRGEG